MKRVYNFAAGPAALPLSVLEKAQKELTDLHGTGMSVMEMSHRSSTFQAIADDAEARLRRLLDIPETYKVLFLQGGASLQFDMLTMNLMHDTKRAYYVNSGNFAKKAAKEAALFGEVVIPASSEEDAYTHLPALRPEMFAGPADYVHITYNNTIYGTEFRAVPDVAGHTLVADMTSCILSEPIRVSDFGAIYAGAQKNIGPAGLTVVLIREDLIGLVKNLPSMLDYAVHAKNGSMYNTPPTFAIYMAGLVFEWMEEQGGVPAIYEANQRKAAMLYNYLDNASRLFHGIVTNKADRSLMSVTFTSGDAELDAQFCKEATAAGLCNLKGHRVAGGMRASLYNAVTEEATAALVRFMADFEARH